MVSRRSPQKGRAAACRRLGPIGKEASRQTNISGISFRWVAVEQPKCDLSGTGGAANKQTQTGWLVCTGRRELIKTQWDLTVAKWTPAAKKRTSSHNKLTRLRSTSPLQHIGQGHMLTLDADKNISMALWTRCYEIRPCAQEHEKSQPCATRQRLRPSAGLYVSFVYQ